MWCIKRCLTQKCCSDLLRPSNLYIRISLKPKSMRWMLECRSRSQSPPQMMRLINCSFDHMASLLLVLLLSHLFPFCVVAWQARVFSSNCPCFSFKWTFNSGRLFRADRELHTYSDANMCVSIVGIKHFCLSIPSIFPGTFEWRDILSEQDRTKKQSNYKSFHCSRMNSMKWKPQKKKVKYDWND